MKINKLKIDESKCDEGVWVEWETEEGVVELKIARLNNPNYTSMLAKLVKPYKNSRNMGGEIPHKAQLDIAARCLGKACLLGWKGLQYDDGKDIPYSEEKSVELIKEVPDLADIVTQEASNNDNFRLEAMENAAKNS